MSKIENNYVILAYKSWNLNLKLSIDFKNKFFR